MRHATKPPLARGGTGLMANPERGFVRHRLLRAAHGDALQDVQLDICYGRGPAEFCARPLSGVPAVDVGGGRWPLGRVLVGLAPVGST